MDALIVMNKLSMPGTYPKRAACSAISRTRIVTVGEKGREEVVGSLAIIGSRRWPIRDIGAQARVVSLIGEVWGRYVVRKTRQDKIRVLLKQSK
jgi:hypothetical protein